MAAPRRVAFSASLEDSNVIAGVVAAAPASRRAASQPGVGEGTPVPEQPAPVPLIARKLQPRKGRYTFHLSHDVVDEARNCVYRLQGPPLCLTLGQLVERALKAELSRLRDQYGGGEAFPSRDANLTGGRNVAPSS